MTCQPPPQSTRRRHLALIALLWVPAALACSAGCGPYARAQLYHPREDGSRQLLHLASYWADFAVGEDGVDRLLLAWPLPGARAGAKQFILYLRMPPGGGRVGAGPDADEGGPVTGFLIQRTGRLAGLTRVARGRVTISAGHQTRQGTLHLKCDDGTEVQGTFRAKRSELAVEFFEDDHRGDVAALPEPSRSNGDEPALAGGLGQRPGAP